MKKLKRYIPGCMVLIAALWLCVPAMAGGYSARSEIKVNHIGIRSWPEEAEVEGDIRLFMEQELPQATPSSASKSDAARIILSPAEDDGLADKRPASASPSNTKPWEDGKEEKGIPDIRNCFHILEGG